MGVAEGKAGRPEFAARVGRQQGPQAADHVRIGPGALEDQPAAIDQHLHSAQEGGAVGHVQDFLDLLHRAVGRLEGAGPFQGGQFAPGLPGWREAVGDLEGVAADGHLVQGQRQHQQAKRQGPGPAGAVLALVGHLHHGHAVAGKRQGEDTAGHGRVGRALAKAGAEPLRRRQPLVEETR